MNLRDVIVFLFGVAVTVSVLFLMRTAYAYDPINDNELVDELYGEDYVSDTFTADSSRVDWLIKELWPTSQQHDGVPRMTASRIDKYDLRTTELESRANAFNDRILELTAEIDALAPTNVLETKKTADAAKMRADTNARHVSVHSGLLTDHEKALWGKDEDGNALTMYNEDDTLRKSLIEVNADAISGQGERLAMIGTGVSGNTSKIGANEDAIGVNAKSIATNAEGVEKNAEALIAHDERINTNAEGIEANVEMLGEHDERIATNTERIATNVEGIAANVTGIAGLDAELYGEAEPDEEGVRVSRIDTNEASIASNVEHIATHATAIDSLGKTDVKHGARITANEAMIKRNGERIDRAEAGVAAAMALAAIAPPSEDQLYSVGVGAGHWASENALAVKGSARIQNAVVSVGAAGNSDDIGGNIGVSWGF